MGEVKREEEGGCVRACVYGCVVYVAVHVCMYVCGGITVTNAFYAHSIDTHYTHTHMRLPFLHVLLLPLLLPSYEHTCGAGAE